ncbi:uncharacterized protein LOC135815275 isoform X2 [Sycon ciliatum]|uniref:uncharacterized protein LOC135815275 isoform X2 n=1 Tax=Sycon ciliatum TaxID=27933 RepID=UPI0031F6B1ED
MEAEEGTTDNCEEYSSAAMDADSITLSRTILRRDDAYAAKDIVSKLQKTFECSICLDLMCDPLSTTCNHQFCRSCIIEVVRSAVSACPLCKHPISKRSLNSNQTLNELLDAVNGVISAAREDLKGVSTPPRQFPPQRASNTPAIRAFALLHPTPHKSPGSQPDSQPDAAGSENPPSTPATLSGISHLSSRSSRKRSLALGPCRSQGGSSAEDPLDVASATADAVMMPPPMPETRIPTKCSAPKAAAGRNVRVGASRSSSTHWSSLAHNRPPQSIRNAAIDDNGDIVPAQSCSGRTPSAPALKPNQCGVCLKIYKCKRNLRQHSCRPSNSRAEGAGIKKRGPKGAHTKNATTAGSVAASTANQQTHSKEQSSSSPSGSVVAESCPEEDCDEDRPIDPMRPYLWKMYQDYVKRTRPDDCSLTDGDHRTETHQQDYTPLEAHAKLGSLSCSSKQHIACDMSKVHAHVSQLAQSVLPREGEPRCDSIQLACSASTRECQPVHQLSSVAHERSTAAAAAITPSPQRNGVDDGALLCSSMQGGSTNSVPGSSSVEYGLAEDAQLNDSVQQCSEALLEGACSAAPGIIRELPNAADPVVVEQRSMDTECNAGRNASHCSPGSLIRDRSVGMEADYEASNQQYSEAILEGAFSTGLDVSQHSPCVVRTIVNQVEAESHVSAETTLHEVGPSLDPISCELTGLSNEKSVLEELLPTICSDTHEVSIAGTNAAASMSDSHVIQATETPEEIGSSCIVPQSHHSKYQHTDHLGSASEWTCPQSPARLVEPSYQADCATNSIRTNTEGSPNTILNSYGGEAITDYGTGGSLSTPADNSIVQCPSDNNVVEASHTMVQTPHANRELDEDQFTQSQSLLAPLLSFQSPNILGSQLATGTGISKIRELPNAADPVVVEQRSMDTECNAGRNASHCSPGSLIRDRSVGMEADYEASNQQYSGAILEGAFSTGLDVSQHSPCVVRTIVNQVEAESHVSAETTLHEVGPSLDPISCELTGLSNEKSVLEESLPTICSDTHEHSIAGTNAAASMSDAHVIQATETPEEIGSSCIVPQSHHNKYQHTDHLGSASEWTCPQSPARLVEPSYQADCATNSIRTNTEGSPNMILNSYGSEAITDYGTGGSLSTPADNSIVQCPSDNNVVEASHTMVQTPHANRELDEDQFTQSQSLLAPLLSFQSPNILGSQLATGTGISSEPLFADGMDETELDPDAKPPCSQSASASGQLQLDNSSSPVLSPDLLDSPHHELHASTLVQPVERIPSTNTSTTRPPTPGSAASSPLLLSSDNPCHPASQPLFSSAARSPESLPDTASCIPASPTGGSVLTPINPTTISAGLAGNEAIEPSYTHSGMPCTNLESQDIQALEGNLEQMRKDMAALTALLGSQLQEEDTAGTSSDESFASACSKPDPSEESAESDVLCENSCSQALHCSQSKLITATPPDSEPCLQRNSLMVSEENVISADLNPFTCHQSSGMCTSSNTASGLSGQCTSPSQMPPSLTPSLNTPHEGVQPFSQQMKQCGSRRLSFVTHDLTHDQVRMAKTVAKYGSGRVASRFNGCTTHVILATSDQGLAEPSLKYLQGIAAGVWIVSMNWIEECYKAGTLLPEEEFEVNGDSSVQSCAPRQSRIAQAEGRRLFHGTNVTFSESIPVTTRDMLAQTMELGGACIVSKAGLTASRHLDGNKQQLHIVRGDTFGVALSQQAASNEENSNQIVPTDWPVQCLLHYRILNPLDLLGNSMP